MFRTFAAMKYLSVCSGIEAASVAFDHLEWKPLAFSEIEPFPRAVLQHRYPDTPLYGDFTELKDMGFIADADILCGGTPCQSFSVAGLRQSLSDDRGNLTLQFVKLANAIDNARTERGEQPAWILWENVPGVLSTRDNAFGSFLAGLAGEELPIEPGPKPADGKSSTYWSWKKDKRTHVPKWPSAGVVDGPERTVAWRVLDAQHFGLAQRRKRVFVLAKGGAGRWAAADALLPIIESSRWHSAPSRSAGEGVAGAATQGAGVGVEGVDHENNPVWAGKPMGPLMKGSPTGGGRPLPVVAFQQNQLGEIRVGEVSGTLNTNSNPSGRNTPMVFDPAQVTSKANRSNPQPGDPCHTLHRNDPPMLVANEYKEMAGPFKDTADALTASYGTKWNGNASAYNGSLFAQAIPINTQLGLRGAETSNSTREGIGIGNEGDPSFTLQAAHSHAVAHGMQVRRLTPVECARLQGFPDNYLDITYRGKPAADGPKYKALGNSWAVPVVRWIGGQIHSCSQKLRDE